MDSEYVSKSYRPRDKISRYLFYTKDVARATTSSKGGELCNKTKRLKVVNYCCKALHIRCLRDFCYVSALSF